MVRSRPHEWSEAGKKSVEGVSPFCRERIYVTQSRTAMSDDAHGSSINHRKFRNLNLTYESRPRQQNGHREAFPASVQNHESMSAKEELSEDTSNQQSVTLTHPTMKKKSLHKIATGALANIGLLFAGVNSGGEDGDLTGGNILKATETCNDSNDLNVGFNDSGIQSKLTPKERFFSKPWKNRQKSTTNAGSSLWTPENDCEWISASGTKVQLTGVNLDELSRAESLALQHISLAKLRKFHLRSNVVVPKDSHTPRRSLRRAFSLKSKASGISFFEKDKEKDTGVFAIPLSKAVAHVAENNNEDQEKGNKSKSSKAKSGAGDEERDPVEPLRIRRHSSSSLHQNVHSSVESAQKKSSPSSKLSQDSPKWKSRLIDALSLLPSSISSASLMDKQTDVGPIPPQVPLIVQKAIGHLERYGLHILGIFRVGGSKKRMKQMREQFDSGEKTDFTAEDNPHDVAALFKEYFRDLPEPLLTRDLYSVFLESQNEEDKAVRVFVLRLLCCLLPIPNRDTLKVLLDFLANVAHYSEDTQDEKGVQVPGNQMTSRNLATLMGPNILHKVKGQHHDFLVEDLARAEEREEVIDVVQEMIEHRTELFKITAENYHEVLVHLLESDSEIVDLILKRKTSKSKIASYEVDEVFLQIGDRKENGRDSRVRTVGEPERPLSRAASAPTSRPSSNLANSAPKGEKRNARGSHSPVPPVRSHSLSQQEAILYRNRIFSRMHSFSAENSGGNLGGSFHSSYRENRRRTPPPMRAARVYRYGDTSPQATSEPPSPALSSTSWSNYSTPPSSPSGSTQYVSADSSLSHSPLEGSYFGEETPTRARLTCILNEVGVEVSCDETNYSESKPPTDFNHFRTQDVQLERWTQWESITQQNKTQRELEQETLV